MDFTRKSGVLLHPSMLPGPFGRGDLGPAAYAFIKGMADASQSVWQILPLGPPGYGGSPYASGSAFAGDALLISPELLVDEGLLDAEDVHGVGWPEGETTPEAEVWRGKMLRKARRRFDAQGDQEALERFRTHHAHWLDDHALFVAIKNAHGGGAFWECWPTELQRREPEALAQARAQHADAVADEVFAQFTFDRQWARLRVFAADHGVQVFGDLPIFVARDSSDLWARPDLFCLGADGRPTVVAGVPPDDFSDTGQLWGNPLYAWDQHAAEGYAWWIARMRRMLETCDLVRVDHFRGFASYWEIPADAETAVTGRWVPGPRTALFEALAQALGEIPVIAEDLGVLTDDVDELMAATAFPGMKIVQFAWSGDPAHPFLPENHPERSVAYTGTHDNETTLGWFDNLVPEVRERVVAKVGDLDVAWALLDYTYSSPAFLAVAPAQDLLSLGNEARTNEPSTSEGNWVWRLLPGQIDVAWPRLREMTLRHGRRSDSGSS